MREHVDKRNRAELCRRYCEGPDQWSELRVLNKKIAESRDSIPTFEEDVSTKNKGETAGVELAAGKGKAA